MSREVRDDAAGAATPATDQTTPPAVLDPERLSALRRSMLLDSPPEAAFDRLTRLAARLLGTPVALVSLVDADRQFFKSSEGLGEPYATLRQTPLSHSFCQYVVASGEPLLVEDARENDLLKNNLAIPDLSVISYAGIPLITSEGHALGSFCVIDNKPRQWTSEEIEVLTDLAASVMTEIELRSTLKKAEAQLSALVELQTNNEYNLALLDALFSHAPIGFAFFDKQHRFVRLNSYLAEMNGIPVNEHLGQRLTDLLPTNALIVDPLIDHVFATGESIEDYEVTGETPASPGITRHWITGFYPVVTASGTIPLVGVFAVEITARKDAETEHVHLLDSERTAREQAEAAIRVRDQVFSVVAHDLRNPITTIKASSQLLRRRLERGSVVASDPAGAAQIIKTLSSVDKIATGMSELIGDILDVVRMQVGQPLDLHMEPSDLAALIRQAVQSARKLAKNHRINFKSDVPELMGQWDSARLTRVLDNLLSNAIKYSPEGSSIDVVLSVEQAGSEPQDSPSSDREDRVRNGWAVISVRDQGIGIPAADIPHIFDWYQRAGNVTSDMIGTGIGLAGARQIVEQHGGTIEVSSAENEGSEFVVRLPIQNLPPAPTE